MAKIVAFRGIRYNSDVADNQIDLLAPPYDVISPDQQDAFYERHPNNIVRLILGKINESDTETDNRYTRSAADLEKWLSDGILVQDETPAIYLYAQDFTINSEKIRRTGFICRRLVDDFGDSVHPHEKTHAGPKIDRLNLTRACKTNFSQVFGLYSDPGRELDALWAEEMKKESTVSVTVGAGEDHHLWVITNRAIIDQVTEFMEDKDVVIADGHHRYTTAINYRAERRKQDGNPDELKAYDYAMMFLANTDSEGFTVLGTHRILKNIDTVNEASLLEQLGQYFQIDSREIDKQNMSDFMSNLADAGMETPSFGMYIGGKVAHILRFSSQLRYFDGETYNGVDKSLRLLDVSILQNLIFEKIVGLSPEELDSKKHVGYTVSGTDVVEQVDSGEAVAGFFMNPTGVDQVIEIATGGCVMPQKSTYFYPKLISGLVMNPLY